MAEKKDIDSTGQAAAGEESTRASVFWNDSDMRTSFANVINIQSTSDQVDLFFGTNQTWNAAQSNNAVTIDLSNRLILTPLVAKRLYQSLGQVIAEHEKRHGELSS